MKLRLLAAALVLLGSLFGCSDYESARRAYERGDYSKARSDYQALASKGDPKAQFDLSHMYYSGVGGVEDPQLGWRYLLQAANSGYPKAMVDLGMRYASGIGTEQSLIMAARWYRRAALLGDPIAPFNLASMHEAGTEVARDPLRAYAWYMIAYKNGNTAGKQRADELRSKMLNEDAERAELLIRKLQSDPEA